MKEEQAKPTLFKHIYSIEVTKISPNPNQPRKSFSDDAIIKLADSIRQFGIMQPLVVRRLGDEYELISGERRLRAAKELGMSCVPCIIEQASEKTSAEMAIIENLMRQDLNIFEQAEAISALIDTHSLTQEEVAARLSNSQSFVANKLRLLRLDKDEREKIINAKLSERHARALLRIYSKDEREKILSTIISQGLNVSKAEELVERHVSKEDKDTKKQKTYKNESSFCETISRAINDAESSGLKIKTRKIESDTQTEIIILISKASRENTGMQEASLV